MYNKLQQLYQALDDTIPKHELRSSSMFDIKSEMSEECRALMNHLVEMKHVYLQHNVYGIPVIRNTTIPLYINMERKGFLSSRYGRIVIPVPVIQ